MQLLDEIFKAIILKMVQYFLLLPETCMMRHLLPSLTHIIKQNECHPTGYLMEQLLCPTIWMMVSAQSDYSFRCISFGAVPLSARQGAKIDLFELEIICRKCKNGSLKILKSRLYLKPFIFIIMYQAMRHYSWRRKHALML